MSEEQQALIAADRRMFATGPYSQLAIINGRHYAQRMDHRHTQSNLQSLLLT